MKKSIELVPAILRRTYEKMEEDWRRVEHVSPHIQLDVTDGIFAGEGTFRHIRHFKRLPNSEKIELHMMVHTPAYFVDDIIDLNPARCIFHLESFAGSGELVPLYQKLRRQTSAQLAVAVNPETPNDYLESLLELLDYVLFMGYNPGWANQPINPIVYKKVATFARRHPGIPIAVDGHVSAETVEPYITAGATILCANTAIFGHGEPVRNYEALLERCRSYAASL